MNYTRFQHIMRPFPVFSVREIEKHSPGFDSRRLVEWQRKGYIEKLRNRWYMFSDKQPDEAFLFFAANKIYSPSYVSLESALSLYGFIPEGVFQITSCSTLKTNKFDAPLGQFKYRNLKKELFWGYRLRQSNRGVYKVAEPEKALIDYFYLNPGLKTADDLKALRLNSREIKDKISLSRIEAFSSYINSSALNKRIELLIKYLHADS